MTRLHDLARAVAAAILGALLGAACVVASYLLAPDLVMQMDTDPPALVRGLYPVERGPDGVSYAWSRDLVTISLPGLDRQHQWQFRIRFRGGREDPRTLPFVQTLVDGDSVDMRQAGNQFQDVAIMLPTTDSHERGARITIRCSNTFIPGPTDNRPLGIIIDEMRVVRLSTGVPFVPRPAVAAATLGGAIFGAFFGLIGLTAGGAAIAVAVLVAGQGIALVHGAGPYTPTYTSLVPWIAGWVAVLAALAVSGAQRWMGQRLRNTARFALAFTVGALYLKLLVLTHPSMPIGDALFQAHRFEWVRDGRYFFTSIAPGGYEFPYAIGLYLAAWPFASLVHGTLGFMVLLRFVVVIADAAAGLLLYPMIARQTGDRLAGAIAVALFHLLPINFLVQTSGKLTNAFGESLFLVCVAVIVLGSGQHTARSRAGMLVLLTLAAVAAMLSHTSMTVVVGLMLVVSAAAIWWFGAKEDADWARALVVVAALSAIVAAGVYYGHFAGSLASQLQRVGGRIETSTPTPAVATEPAATASASTPAAPLAAAGPPAARPSLGERLAELPFDLDAWYGWPAMTLAVIGGVALVRRRERVTLTLATWSWLAIAAVLVVVGLVTRLPVRAELLAFPAIALLAARGAAFWWRVGPFAQAGAIVLLLGTVVSGIHNWIAPLR